AGGGSRRAAHAARPRRRGTWHKPRHAGAAAPRATGARGARRRAAPHRVGLGGPRLRGRRDRSRDATDPPQSARHPDGWVHPAQSLGRFRAAHAGPDRPGRYRGEKRDQRELPELPEPLQGVRARSRAQRGAAGVRRRMRIGLTTAALAILADEGKLSWDDPVTKFLPGFALYDPYVTRELTVRDLVTHRSGLGLGAGDLLWFHSNYSRAEIAYRIRFAKPASSFRSAYAYDNVLYIVAGEIVPAVAGTTWDEFVTR